MCRCRLRESWQHLVRDRATRSLTYNDEQFHVLERITVAETARRARALLQRAAPLARARADAIADWSVHTIPHLQCHHLSATAPCCSAPRRRHRRLVNSPKADTSGDAGEKTREMGGGNAQKSNGAGGVTARGAGVRALLAAHGDLAHQLRANSALLTRLADLAQQLQP
ncbi:hypothetical protein HF086_001162 [Spodoptera exigua]|uniref:TANK-binding kinase 1 coiled-coil domain-containing protein n=1 Tax=Spodoptera exigua TaxID=7107 RepID=A0A922M1U8_SPOEX|nr:hypothetical protein HF086_001162 [Spodoptera exigua]